ncbi:histone-lysine N-methyltransferase SETMAR [Trichonephila inaurata madagascariensis]|uniref:Histone-lysine N-methyltransferase SETMAR n=1 Tax=Trichonephila inaurata madagascariensis TaxID=2747483 RepID=A0A8X6I3Z9_9ARAC|nr:histone-lysine N-methyltransferase SETMAR [Trichonephila inaurata madagascariensis]
MVKYTNEQRLQILKIYYRNSESVAAILRALTPIFGRNSCPSRQAVTRLVKKFESTYSLCDVVVPVRLRVDRSVENIAAVETSIANDPNQSIPRRSKELGIAKTTIWRILRKWTSQFAASFVRFNASRFFSLGLRQESLVYANKPTTLEELKANIEREIAAFSAEMCGRVMENWVHRIDRCKRARGGHMSEVEFHS